MSSRLLKSPIPARTWVPPSLSDTFTRARSNAAAAASGAVALDDGLWLDVYYPPRSEAPSLDPVRDELERSARGAVAGMASGLAQEMRRDTRKPDPPERIRRTENHQALSAMQRPHSACRRPTVLAADRHVAEPLTA